MRKGPGFAKARPDLEAPVFFDDADGFGQAPQDTGPGDVWLYGVQPVLEALEGGERRIEKIWVAYGRAGAGAARILSLAYGRKIPVTKRDVHTLTEKAGTGKHQGVVALCSPVERVTLDDFLEGLPQGRRRFLVLLDGVEDPHNLGAVLRSASAAGVEGVLLPRRRVSPVTPVVAKASAGALERIPLVEAGNATEAVQRLQERGIQVIGADPEGEKPLFDADLRGDLCLVLGGEGKGLRPGLHKHCDFRVSIPMAGPVASLNVSVAAGVLFYEVVRQRRGIESPGGQ